ncbi:hypothetical protein SCUCBS95973_000964 [Sporothrix curviconia]|uniref:Uncharacterized protein n=1 Tax=Sporothrix curviconia TaxID=1260050 RepID=A0ABP0AUK4_9PEZI
MILNRRHSKMGLYLGPHHERDKIASPFKPAPTHLEEQSQPRIIDDVQAPAILADSDAKPAMEAVRVEIPDGLGVVTATATDAAAGPPVSASQALWDDAFTLIEEDPETKELSEKYLALLDKTLGDGNKGLDSKVTEAGPKPAGAALRQAQMMQLVKAG